MGDHSALSMVRPALRGHSLMPFKLKGLATGFPERVKVTLRTFFLSRNDFSEMCDAWRVFFRRGFSPSLAKKWPSNDFAPH